VVFIFNFKKVTHAVYEEFDKKEGCGKNEF
jgi:hypothetical protein